MHLDLISKNVSNPSAFPLPLELLSEFKASGGWRRSPKSILNFSSKPICFQYLTSLRMSDALNYRDARLPFKIIYCIQFTKTETLQKESKKKIWNKSRFEQNRKLGGLELSQRQPLRFKRFDFVFELFPAGYLLQLVGVRCFTGFELLFELLWLAESSS